MTGGFKKYDFIKKRAHSRMCEVYPFAKHYAGVGKLDDYLKILGTGRLSPETAAF
jgi:hypothetical protein